MTVHLDITVNLTPAMLERLALLHNAEITYWDDELYSELALSDNEYRAIVQAEIDKRRPSDIQP